MKHSLRRRDSSGGGGRLSFKARKLRHEPKVAGVSGRGGEGRKERGKNLRESKRKRPAESEARFNTLWLVWVK